VSGRQVTVVADDAADPIRDALASAETDVAVETLTPADVAAGTFGDSRVVVAVGEPALLAAAQSVPDSPIVPVDTGTRRYDVSAAAVGAAVDAAAAATLDTVSHPVLDVSVAGESAGTAVLDVTLLTADPARISEFAVGSDDGWTEAIRADGVVVATPLGSTGYAHAVGGPVLAPGTGVVAAPISAYAMHVRPWVLRPPVSVSVERDEARVTLRLDDEVTRPVPPDVQVDITVGASVSVVAPQQFAEE
jgi:NAD+ kinase